MFPVKNPYQIQNAMIRLWTYNLETQRRVLQTLGVYAPDTEASEVVATTKPVKAAAGKPLKKRTRAPSQPGATAKRKRQSVLTGEEGTDNMPI